jgi:DNA-directed RNA polymerase specialized sigma subunit
VQNGIRDKVRLNMWISRSVYDELHTIKEAEGRVLIDLVREALSEYVKRYRRENIDERRGEASI